MVCTTVTIVHPPTQDGESDSRSLALKQRIEKFGIQAGICSTDDLVRFGDDGLLLIVDEPVERARLCVLRAGIQNRCIIRPHVDSNQTTQQLINLAQVAQVVVLARRESCTVAGILSTDNHVSFWRDHGAANIFVSEAAGSVCSNGTSSDGDCWSGNTSADLDFTATLVVMIAGRCSTELSRRMADAAVKLSLPQETRQDAVNLRRWRLPVYHTISVAIVGSLLVIAAIVFGR